MKLTGEYTITDNGVIIEGRIHGTHIAELRERFTSDDVIRSTYVGNIFAGDPEMMSPVGAARVQSLGTRWFSAAHQKSIIDFKKIMRDLGFQPTELGVQHEITRMGLGVEQARSLFYETKLRYLRPGTRRYASITCKVVQCGWVFGNTQADGSFKVELYGLVNRHILSAILGKATVYAKLLDHKDVLTATEKPEGLSARMAGWF